MGKYQHMYWRLGSKVRMKGCKYMVKEFPFNNLLERSKLRPQTKFVDYKFRWIRRNRQEDPWNYNCLSTWICKTFSQVCYLSKKNFTYLHGSTIDVGSRKRFMFFLTVWFVSRTDAGCQALVWYLNDKETNTNRTNI